MKILIVDDEPDIRLIVRYVLSTSPDIEVLEAEDGRRAVLLAEEHRPDVILLDRYMPVLDGPATLTELRNNPATASIPILFLTATRNPRELDQLRKMGAGILLKPFDPQNLKQDILNALAAG